MLLTLSWPRQRDVRARARSTIFLDCLAAAAKEKKRTTKSFSIFHLDRSQKAIKGGFLHGREKKRMALLHSSTNLLFSSSFAAKKQKQWKGGDHKINGRQCTQIKEKGDFRRLSRRFHISSYDYISFVSLTLSKKSSFFPHKCHIAKKPNLFSYVRSNMKTAGKKFVEKNRMFLSQCSKNFSFNRRWS